jgi:tRNA-Thr(GGU) m(6)t(6)A37 methyltransferase TsaA
MSRRQIQLEPIGYVRSVLQNRTEAPRQWFKGAPSAQLELDPAFQEAVEGLAPGQEIWLLTWLDRAHRSTLKVHPRGDPANPLTGVFATRSPDRPNPIGLHRLRIKAIPSASCLEVDELEALDGTPILDIKPVLARAGGS